MALITCPECGKEISDKAPACIHCGYPIKKENHYQGIEHLIYKPNKYYGVKLFNQLYMSSNAKQIISSIQVLSGYHTGEILADGLSKERAEILLEYINGSGGQGAIFADDYSTSENIKLSRFIDSRLDSNAPLSCPKCGSTSVSVGQRGYSTFWGFWGSNNTMNRCAKCGFKWQPIK